MLHIFYKQNFNKQHQAEIWLEIITISAEQVALTPPSIDTPTRLTLFLQENFELPLFSSMIFQISILYK